jgi:hypothetical protein
LRGRRHPHTLRAFVPCVLAAGLLLLFVAWLAGAIWILVEVLTNRCGGDELCDRQAEASFGVAQLLVAFGGAGFGLLRCWRAWRSRSTEPLDEVLLRVTATLLVAWGGSLFFLGIARSVS